MSGCNYWFRVAGLHVSASDFLDLYLGLSGFGVPRPHLQDHQDLVT